MSAQYFDTQAHQFFTTYVHNPNLDKIMIFLTERLIFAILGVFFLLTAWRVWRHPEHRSKMLPASFAIITAAITTTILKQFFAIPRPFESMPGLEPLVEASLGSFPSGHTAVAFALLIPIYRISKTIGTSWAVFAIMIGFARVYENVHFPSDIAGGIFLGGLIGAIFSNHNTELLLKNWWNDLEFRRQSFHFLLGFFCVYAHWIGVLRLRFVVLLILVGLMVSILSVKQKIPIISNLLQLFDRPRDKNFPGRGAFYYLFGILLTLFIFPVKIAYASILILSVGDSLNHLFADRSPQHRVINLPWNRKKSLTGLLIGVVAGTFASQFFVPLIPAFIASSVALLIETYHIKLGSLYLDDNVLVPLVAGGLLFVMV